MQHLHLKKIRSSAGLGNKKTLNKARKVKLNKTKAKKAAASTGTATAGSYDPDGYLLSKGTIAPSRTQSPTGEASAGGDSVGRREIVENTTIGEGSQQKQVDLSCNDPDKANYGANWPIA